MIVTAPYRCGGTSLALKLAQEHNLVFAGQIDSNSVAYTRMEDKNTVHEYQNQPEHTIEIVNSLLTNHTNHVILNNSNVALFKETDFFIKRRDMMSSYTSFIWLMKRFYPNLSKTYVESMFKRRVFFDAMMLHHCKVNGIAPLVLEEQDWFNETEPKPVEQWIIDLARPHVEYLKEFE
jgi:hypothetical protein